MITKLLTPKGQTTAQSPMIEVLSKLNLVKIQEIPKISLCGNIILNMHKAFGYRLNNFDASVP